MTGPAWLRAFSEVPSLGLDPACVTCTPATRDPDVIAFSPHWKVVLHTDQTVPGACLVGSHRHVSKIGLLSTSEMADFFAVYAALEAALESSLGADLVNLSCLRNWAYRSADPEPPWRDGVPNPHVHWHVAPRYREPVVVGDETFVDIDFGEPLTWRRQRLDAGDRFALIDRLRASMDVVLVPLPSDTGDG